MKRFIVDWVGNFTFFVPIVILLAGFMIPTILGDSTWDWGVIKNYIIGSVFIAAFSGRLFTLFLAKIWYPLFQEKF